MPPPAAQYASCDEATRKFVYGGPAQAASLNVSASSSASVTCPHTATQCCISGNTEPVYACLRDPDAARTQACSKHAVNGRTAGVRFATP